MSAYAELLKELQGTHEALAKSMPTDGDGDEKIAAAAAEGGDGGKGDGETGGEEGKAGDGDGDETIVAKSFTVKLEDGSEAEALDATELIKSLTDQVGALGGKLNETETTLAKALGDTLQLVKGQSELIKSLSERVTKLAGEGRGRKTVVTVHEPLAKSQPTEEPKAPTGAEVLAKALTAQKEGKLMAHQVSAIETYIGRGMPIPEHLAKALA